MTTLDPATLSTLAEAADYMAAESTTDDRGGRCSAYLREAADKARGNITGFVIATERLGTHVGSGGPTVYATRAEARAEADSLQESTPSKYGKLIVRKLS